MSERDFAEFGQRVEKRIRILGTPRRREAANVIGVALLAAASGFASDSATA